MCSGNTTPTGFVKTLWYTEDPCGPDQGRRGGDMDRVDVIGVCNLQWLLRGCCQGRIED